MLSEKEGTQQGSDAQEEGLDGVSVLRGDLEGVRVLVVDLVHVLVHALVVQSAVDPVKVKILDDEESRELPRDVSDRGRGRAIVPEELRHPWNWSCMGSWMNTCERRRRLRHFATMAPSAFLDGLDLVLVEVRDLVEHQPQDPQRRSRRARGTRTSAAPRSRTARSYPARRSTPRSSWRAQAPPPSPAGR